jgi:hypothetical protein
MDFISKAQVLVDQKDVDTAFGKGAMGDNRRPAEAVIAAAVEAFGRFGAGRLLVESDGVHGRGCGLGSGDGSLDIRDDFVAAN